ncbi:MAG: Fic family protein [Bacilli bacterium]|nr:Fic family protein [Bacilli bacterium]
MGPENGVNLSRVEYFNINDYINKIKLDSNLLYHLEDTNKAFDDYIKLLQNLDKENVALFLKFAFQDEIKKSNQIEKHIINPNDIDDKDIFYKSLNISHNRIKEMHKFALNSNKKTDYRKDIAWIGYFDKQHNPFIYWYGVEPEDINKFMEDFFEFYNKGSISSINSNPFLKSALASLLFIRIHPFGDGNGRTSRLLYDMKFTEIVNKLYNLKLKIAPLHISNSILRTQPTYAKRINDLYFDLEHDCNDEINKWLDFCLNMTDEQIYFLTNCLKTNEKAFSSPSKSSKRDVKKLAKKISLNNKKGFITSFLL